MLTIQEVGSEIMKNHPRPFYIMTGSEYGVKRMYIKILTEHYGQCKEADSVEELLKLMSTKHFIPLEPAVYVVRYDESFVSSINDRTSSTIRNTKIIGTIVCLYESNKHESRVEKYLGDYTVHIDKVSPAFVSKYLHRDYPYLSDTFIEAAVEGCVDWYEADSLCRCLMLADRESLDKLSKHDIKVAFAKAQELDDKMIKPIIASRDFGKLMYLLDKKDGQEDELIYSVLSTMLELEKISFNKFTESSLRPYQKLWKLEDIYNMFMQTYFQLKKLRSISSNAKDSLMYLFSLMQFAQIPSVEVMS